MSLSSNTRLSLHMLNRLLCPANGALIHPKTINKSMIGSIHTGTAVLGNGDPSAWGGELGAGAGKGGGSGGSIRDAGGSFGRMEAAREDDFYYKLQKTQLKQLRGQIEQELAYHLAQVEYHQEAIGRHLKKQKELLNEEANVKQKGKTHSHQKN